jgi:putative acetyltransferase
MTLNIILREVLLSDNEKLANIIRTVLIEFGGNKPGTAYFDYDTDHMFEAYQKSGQVYYVAELSGKLVGGCGIKQLNNGNTDFCELQKLYLLTDSRGRGIGKLLLEKCLQFAKRAFYKKCYLETFPNMDAAIHLYLTCGFEKLSSPIGNTGHCGCDVWMIKNL